MNFIESDVNPSTLDRIKFRLMEWKGLTVGESVIGRTASILSALRSGGERGLRLVDVAAHAGITRPSVHRLLSELIDVGYVEQLPDRRYRLGSGIYLLGLYAPTPPWNLPAIRNVAERLAEQSGDTVYVAIRRVDGVHYLMRFDGHYPIRSHVVSVGETKPFASTYSGIALFSTFSDAQRELTIRQSLMVGGQDFAGVTANDESVLRDLVEEVRQRGYCAGSGVVAPGITGMAAPAWHGAEPAHFAISISAVDGRLTNDRIEQLAPSLLAAARQIATFTDPTTATLEGLSDESTD